MVREGKPQGFFYLDHRSMDGRHTIITASHVTPASVHDSRPYLSRRDRQCDRFGFAVEAVGLDAGYMTVAISKGLEDRQLYGVIGYRRPTHKKGYFYKWQFNTEQHMVCNLNFELFDDTDMVGGDGSEPTRLQIPSRSWSDASVGDQHFKYSRSDSPRGFICSIVLVSPRCPRI